MTGGNLFTGFQNGVGPQGQASTDGNRDSTVVEFTPAGAVVRQWDIRGKCDGLTADPYTGQVIATVNEDLNSSLYAVDPGSGQVVHHRYSRPLPHHGGTDAITFYRGMMLISASAPGTTGAAAPNPAYPAVYSVTLDPGHRLASPTRRRHHRVVLAGYRPGRGDPVRRERRARHLPGPGIPGGLRGSAQHVHGSDHGGEAPRAAPRAAGHDLRPRLTDDANSGFLPQLKIAAGAPMNLPLAGRRNRTELC
jgi:hypothetical protein